MKYLSVIIFLVAMNWTWALATHKQAIPEQIHVGIQDDLKRIITDYIQENLPNSKNLRFERFYTEPLSDKKVKASFIYSFEDSSEQVGNARVQIEGYAMLNKASESADSVDWSFDDLVILNNSVDYKDPLNVTPQPASDTAAPTEKPEKAE